MKERILTKWTFVRVLYFIVGIALIVQSIINHQWIGVAFGSYLTSMSLFAFGCASGNCFTSNYTVNSKQKPAIQDVYFEEVKTK